MQHEQRQCAEKINGEKELHRSGYGAGKESDQEKHC
jgi:hypothetical protein